MRAEPKLLKLEAKNMANKNGRAVSKINRASGRGRGICEPFYDNILARPVATETRSKNNRNSSREGASRMSHE